MKIDEQRVNHCQSPNGSSSCCVFSVFEHPSFQQDAHAIIRKSGREPAGAGVLKVQHLYCPLKADTREGVTQKEKLCTVTVMFLGGSSGPSAF